MRVYFQASDSNSSTPNWLLYSPGNNQLADTTLNQDFQWVFQSNETHYLIIRGDGNLTDSFDYQFQIIPTLANPTAENLPFNHLTTGTISEIGQQKTYTFSGTVGQQLYFDGQGSDQFTAQILTPGGQEIFHDNVNSDSNNLILAETGTYQVVIDGTDNTTGNYNFRLANLATLETLPLDMAVTGTLAAQATKLYQLDSTAGDKLELTAQSLAGDADWVLYGPGTKPDGSTTIASAQIDSNLTTFLPLEGRHNSLYTLAIRNKSDGAINFGFTAKLTESPSVTNSGLGEIISGSYSVGETKQHQFTAAAGTLIILDGLSTTGRIRTALVRPDGTEIFSNHDTYNDTGVYLLDQSGEYTVKVFDYYNNANRSYQFQILDLATAPEINLQEVISGDFGTTKLETDLYRFDGEAGQRIFFNRITGDDLNEWGLYNDSGVRLNWTRLGWAYGQGGDFERTLPYTGEYVIRLSGSNRNNNNYSFELLENQWSTTEYTIGQTISGEQISIWEPGDRDTYTFSGTAGQKLYFDSLEASNTYIDWQLIDPNGRVIFNSDVRNDQFIALTETGNYTLNIDGVGYNYRGYQQYLDATGSYGFRIFDWSDLPSINLEEVVSGDFGDNKLQTDLYRFSGEAGQRIFFNRLSGDDLNEWGLYNDSGVRLNWTRLGWAYGQGGDFERTLPYTGEYVIRLNGLNRNNNNYSFELLENQWSTTQYTIGQTISGEQISIWEPGDRDTYTFSGTAGQRLYFDSLEASNTYIDWQLIDPNGRVIFNSDVRNDRFITLTETGQYTLNIDGVGYNYRGYQQHLDATGSYGFRILDWSDLPSINLEEVVSGDFGPGKLQTDLYRFSGEAGQRIFFNRLSGDDSNEWGLYTDSGVRLTWTRLGWVSGQGGDFERTLPYTGEYVIRLSGSNRNNNNYSFKLLENQWSTTQYTIGQTISGEQISIWEPGDRDTYTFAGTAGQRLYFDSLENSNSNIDWKLIDPNGRVVFNSDVRNDKFITLTKTGNYTLNIDGVGYRYNNNPYQQNQDATGSYGFRIFDWSELPSINLEEVVSGDFGPGRETDLYRFSGEAGQRIFFNRLSGASNYSSNYWGLYTNTGVSLNWTRFRYYGDAGDFERTLPYTGEYILRLSGNGDNSNTYSFNLILNSWSNNEYTIGETVSGADISISEPGDRDTYTFSGTAGQRLYFDSLEDSNSNIDWKLIDPNGKVIFNSDVKNDKFITLTATGNYTLNIDGVGYNHGGYQRNQDAIGSYGFRIFDWSNLTPINLDETISGDFGSGKRETDLYSFRGQAGQRLLFDRTIGNYYNNWGLYNSKGKLITAWERLSADFEYTLTNSDDYVLRLTGNGNNDSNYSFQIISSELVTTALTLGEVVSSQISKGGEQDTYTFEGRTAQQLVFDALQGQANLKARLYSPSNRLVLDTNTRSDNAPKTLTETGTYRLVIDGDNTATGSYSFNLQDIAHGTTLDLATPITGSLDRGQGVNLYQLNGTKGQVFNFNLDATSWHGATWVFYDPGNNIIANPDINNPDFSATLTTDGTYTLAIIGDSSNSVDYSFEVTDNTPASIPHTGFNTTVTGTIASGGAIDQYTFEASAGTLIWLDQLSSDNWQVRARLKNPDGTYAFTNHYTNDDLGAIHLQQTGQYTLETFGSSWVTGSWQFRILELVSDHTSAQFEPQPFNQVRTNTLESATSSHIYQIDAIVGQKLSLNWMEGHYLDFRIIDPSGQQIFAQTKYPYSTDTVLPTFSQTGIYHLIVDGKQGGERDYAFQLLNLATGQELPLNLPVRGTLENGKQTNLYQLVGKEGQQLFFQANLGNTSTRIQIFNSNLENKLKETNLSPGYNFELTLPNDGIYTVVVEGRGSDSPVDYEFLVFAPSSSIAIDNVIVPGEGEHHNSNGDVLAEFPVQIAAFDGRGGEGIQDYRLRLLPDPDNTAPAIISEPETRVTLSDEVYRYQLQSLDPDGDDLQYRLVESPLGTLINKDTGELLWFLNESVSVGETYNFTVEVRDGRGGIDTQTFQVEVFEDLGTIQGFVFDDLNKNGILDFSLVQGDSPDVYFVVEYSCAVNGGDVDWTTADLHTAFSNELTPVDRELGAILLLNEYLIERGFGETANIGILDGRGEVFDMDPSQEGIQITTNPLADNNNNGIADIIEAIRQPLYGSSPDAIIKAIDLHNGLESDNDLNIIFMSSGNFILKEEQKKAIDLAKAEGTNISAFSFSQRAMDKMRQIDEEATLIESTQQIYDIFTGNVLSANFEPKFIQEPFLENVTVYLDLNGNGVLDPDEPKQATKQPQGISRLEKSNYYFSFDNLLPGDYRVRQVVPENYFETAPSSGEFIDTIETSNDTYSHFFGIAEREEVSTNQSPSFISTAPTGSLEVGETLIYRAEAVDDDLDSLSYNLALGPSGMAVEPETGVVLWTPNPEQVGTNPGALLRVSDGQGGADTQYFELSVTAPNQAPVFTSQIDDNLSPQIGKPFQYQAVALDPDNDPVTYQLGSGNPAGVTMDADTGLLTWTPQSNQLGAREITIEASDDKGATATQILNLNVITAQPNRSPSFTSTPRKNVRIGSHYFYQATATDPDGDPNRFNLITAPHGMTVDEGGRVIWSPNAAQFGSHSVEIQVTDGQGGEARQSFTLAATDRDSNNLPSITSTPNTRTHIHKLYTYQPTATDPDGDLLLWSLEHGPRGMVLDPHTGAISWQPDNQQIGSHTVEIKVADTLGASVSQEFTLTVTGINTPPAIVSTPGTRGTVNTDYSYQVAAKDPENDVLRYSLGLHPHGLTIDEETGLISWTPTAAGNYEISVIVSDPLGASNRQTYNLEVGTAAINQAPEITSTPGVLADSNSRYSYQIEAHDPEGDTLHYQ